MNSWVRLWHDMPTDPKWRVVARKSGQTIPNVLAVFSFLMIHASQNSERRGTVENFDNEDVAAALDILPEDVEAIIHAMQGKVLDGMRLTGWDKRQPKREDNSAERVKAYREKKRTEANAGAQHETPANGVKRIVTQCNAPDTDAETETDSEEEGTNVPVKSDDLTELVSDWNDLAGELGLPKVAKLTEARKRAARCRLKQNTLDEWKEAFRAIRRSSHCQGDNDRGWRADFDFLLQPKSFARLIEGFYDGKV